MLGIVRVLDNLEGAPEHRFGLGVVLTLLVKQREVAKIGGGSGMIGAQRRLVDLERATVERLGGVEIALGVMREGEIVQRRRDIGVVGAELAFEERKRALESGERRFVIAREISRRSLFLQLGGQKILVAFGRAGRGLAEKLGRGGVLDLSHLKLAGQRPGDDRRARAPLGRRPSVAAFLGAFVRRQAYEVDDAAVFAVLKRVAGLGEQRGRRRFVDSQRLQPVPGCVEGVLELRPSDLDVGRGNPLSGKQGPVLLVRARRRVLVARRRLILTFRLRLIGARARATTASENHSDQRAGQGETRGRDREVEPFLGRIQRQQIAAANAFEDDLQLGENSPDLLLDGVSHDAFSPNPVITFASGAAMITCAFGRGNRCCDIDGGPHHNHSRPMFTIGLAGGPTGFDPLILLLAALVFEALVGEARFLFRFVPHPVRLIGGAVEYMDRKLNREARTEMDRAIRGGIVVMVVAAACFGVGSAVAWLSLVHPWGALAELLLLVSLVAQRGLYARVRAVGTALDGPGLEAGRAAVAHIVGRDTGALDGHGVARAALESCAENFCDGVVAPVFWYVLFGFPGLLVYKAVNTMDSVIGHRTPRHRAFGFVAARTDDILNLIPARLAGLFLVIAAVFTPTAGPGAALSVMLRDAGKHRSPNAGWTEGAMAGALGIALAGPRSYGGQSEPDPWIGDGRATATVRDIRRGLYVYAVGCLVNAAWVGALVVVRLEMAG